MFYKNFFKIKSVLPWRCYYFIADSNEYMAVNIFKKAKIPVRFGNGFQPWGSDYCIVGCSFAAKDEEKFISCMEELKANMLIRGHADYNDFCEEFEEVFSHSGTMFQNQKEEVIS